MTAADGKARAKAYLAKAEQYLASAEDNLVARRFTPAAGDAIHAGISAKDAIVTSLVGTTSKGRDHAAAAKELKAALGRRDHAAATERALRELVSAKSDVEYGAALVDLKKAEALVRRASRMVDVARDVIRLGR